jgi:hypothetical protein
MMIEAWEPEIVPGTVAIAVPFGLTREHLGRMQNFFAREGYCGALRVKAPVGMTQSMA